MMLTLRRKTLLVLTVISATATLISANELHEEDAEGYRQARFKEGPTNYNFHQYHNNDSRVNNGNVGTAMGFSQNIATTTNPAFLPASHNAPAEQRFVRIAVVGRSGSGVSSTIRELIGPHTKCMKPEGAETLRNIYEYTVSDIPHTSSQLKLVDIPGFVDGRTLEQDSQILATMKSYYVMESSPPDFFLALSRFDDNRYVGPHSLFTQFLKRLDLFKTEFVETLPRNKMNIIFLLTRLMSETKMIQRRPNDKINGFRGVIEEFTSFEPQNRILVGDNKASAEHNANVENGYSKLPNKEYYPKNVWEAMLNSAVPEASSVHSVFNAMKDNRETEMKCEAKLISTNWDEYDADADAFLYLLQKQPNLKIEDTEVNLKIQNAFDGFPLIPDRRDAVIQKTALQLYLQNENITNIQDIPTSYADRAALFQKSSLISSIYPALLLIEAFKLEMPEYIDPLTVGYGYDVLADELSLETPFKTVISLPSPVGYQFPNFMKCKKFPFADTQTFQSYSNNMSDYYLERRGYLNFEGKEDINVAEFKGEVKEGFNIPPEESSPIATLWATKEVRTLKCTLAEKDHWGELNEGFVEVLNVLTPVDLYDKDSVRDWQSFFGKYGTHIVVQGYGGGRLRGNMVGTKLKKVFDSRSTINETLESILKFSPFTVPDLEKPSYDLFGGEVGNGNGNSQIGRLYDLQEDTRDDLLNEWGKSLNSNFKMLKNEFTLERISTVVTEKIGRDKGRMVDNAIGLLLKGELVKKRRTKGNITSANRNAGNRESTGSSSRPLTTTQPSRIPSHSPMRHVMNYPHNNTVKTVIPITTFIPVVAPLPAPPPSSYSRNTSGGGLYDPYPPIPTFNSTENNFHSPLESQSQLTNSTINAFKQTLDEQNRKVADRHRAEFEARERLHQDQLHAKGQKINSTLSQAQNVNETGYIRHQQTLSSWKEQMELERRHTQTLIDNMRREDERSEANHQGFLDEMRRQEWERKQREIQSRCAGINAGKPICWGGDVKDFFFYAFDSYGKKRLG